MKKILNSLLLISVIFITSCGNNNPEKSLAEKRIIQKIESNSMGMLNDLNVEKVEKTNDSVYIGIHSFTNPLVGKEVRITRNYTFKNDFDEITDYEDIMFEIKSEGEWVETDIGF